jgi:hypothetical protein
LVPEDLLGNDSSVGSDDIPHTGGLKKTKSTLFGLEAEEYLNLDDFQIVFYEPKNKDKNKIREATPEKIEQIKKSKKKKKHKGNQKKDIGK